jgi:hypothetical protein
MVYNIGPLFSMQSSRGSPGGKEEAEVDVPQPQREQPDGNSLGREQVSCAMILSSLSRNEGRQTIQITIDAILLRK